MRALLRGNAPRQGTASLKRQGTPSRNEVQGPQALRRPHSRPRTAGTKKRGREHLFGRRHVLFPTVPGEHSEVGRRLQRPVPVAPFGPKGRPTRATKRSIPEAQRPDVARNGQAWTWPLSLASVAPVPFLCGE